MGFLILLHIKEEGNPKAVFLAQKILTHIYVYISGKNDMF